MDEESSFMLDVGNEGAEPEEHHKSFRRRKKQLYQSIRKQMEFYFSDSNLTKDRFLGSLLKQDPCVDLSMFIRFNKIRALTTNVSEIAKALRNSELLSVTEDGTKVFRTKPVQEKENVDDCTIYVEQLPPDADHDWLRDEFSAYGNVSYVSIPKYRTSGKIKGFAFVEFESPEEASKTLEAFGARGCRLSSEIAPEKLCSISTFEADEERANKNESQGGEDKRQQNEREDAHQEHKRKNINLNKEGSKENVKDLDKEEILQEESSSNKHIKHEICSEENEQHREKKSDHTKRKSAKHQEERIKVEKTDESEQIEETSTSAKRKRKKHSEDEENVEETEPDVSQKRSKPLEQQNLEETKVEDSTKRKRKKKHDDDILEEEDTENCTPSKKIKTEATENEGTELTEPENSQMDQNVKKKRKREAEEEDTENINEEEDPTSENRNEEVAETWDAENTEEGETKRKRKRKKKNKIKKDKQDSDASSLQILSKREWKRLRNKYLDLQRAKMKCLKQYMSKQYWMNQAQQCNTDVPETEDKVSKPRVAFTPGVIVHAALDEPVMDIRKFKADTKALSDVQYVDVMAGANEAYIRCGTADGAKQLASSNPWVSADVLEGEEETEYWDKIMADRTVKFSKKVRPKQRGRDKILRRAERELGKHIKFDE